MWAFGNSWQYFNSLFLGEIFYQAVQVPHKLASTVSINSFYLHFLFLSVSSILSFSPNTLNIYFQVHLLTKRSTWGIQLITKRKMCEIQTWGSRVGKNLQSMGNNCTGSPIWMWLVLEACLETLIDWLIFRLTEGNRQDGKSTCLFGRSRTSHRSRLRYLQLSLQTMNVRLSSEMSVESLSLLFRNSC